MRKTSLIVFYSSISFVFQFFSTEHSDFCYIFYYGFSFFVFNRESYWEVM